MKRPSVLSRATKRMASLESLSKMNKSFEKLAIEEESKNDKFDISSFK